MASSVGVKSGFARHGRAIVSIILFQTLLIVWLSAWAVEDYINNQYVRAYVDNVIQSEGWIFGVLAFTSVLGSVLGLYARRSRHASNTLELVNTGTTVPISTPVSTSTAAASSTSAVELHPAVAALKAELSERRMSLGLSPVPTSPAREAGEPAKFEDQKTMVGTQRSQSIQSSMIGPRPPPAMLSTIPPSTVIRPTPTTVIRPLPPTVIRPMLQSQGSAVHPQTTPLLKIESGTTPLGVMPRQDAAPALSQDSTVITGIVPVQQQKKKDPESPAGQNSQQ